MVFCLALLGRSLLVPFSLHTNKKAHDCAWTFLFGGDKGTRTPGLSIANAALYQLSYIPTAQNILQHIRAKCKSFVLAWWDKFCGGAKKFVVPYWLSPAKQVYYPLSVAADATEYGGVAQLARAFGSYPECHWFESNRRYHIKHSASAGCFFYCTLLHYLAFCRHYFLFIGTINNTSS